MKSIMINDIIYSVGDEVYLIKNNIDIHKIGVGNYQKCINKVFITKITSAGYVYVKSNDKFTCEIKLDKNGSWGTYDSSKRVLTPYNEEIENILNRCEMEHNYIQNTFKRMKLVTKLSYDKAEKINSLLDEIGIDKVEER